jgi:acetolactate synthase-1/2/3 large subunit
VTLSPADAPSTTQTAADSVIAALEQAGVSTIFGIPGVHTLALYDALTRTDRVRHILTRHEQGAGFMADGYARATGEPGVALVITGPGLTNISTAVGQAYTDSSPVVVLSTNVERPYLDAMRGSLHDLTDQRKLMSTITKSSVRVNHPEEAAQVTSDALTHAVSGRRLPRHVEFPKDVLDDVIPARQPIRSKPTTVAIDRIAIGKAVAMLAAAKRPLVYAGGGVIAANATEQLFHLANRLGAPVVTSIQGKGAFPESHRLSLGTLWAADNAVDALIRSADLVLVVGSKLGVQSTEHFSMPLPTTMIRIDIDDEELSRNYSPTLAIRADAGDALFHLLQALPDVESTWTADEIDRVRADATATNWGIDRVAWIEAIRSAMGADGIVAWDMTMMSYVACSLYTVEKPRTFLFPHGFGTLGFALPAAIGAKIGRTDTPVACVVGDGGFQFTMQEVATAIQHNVGLPVIIFNDSTYSAVKDEQGRTRDGNFVAVDLVNPDFVKLADAYGIPGVRVNDPAGLQSEIAAALGRDVPTIIDVPIPGWA